MYWSTIVLRVKLTKNQTISLKKLLQTIVLLVFATTWLNSASASFVCVCSDGHTSVENIYSSECHQIEFQNHSDDIQINLQHDCEDTLLLSNGINSSSTHFENIKQQETQLVTNFIQPIKVSINQSQVYLSTPYIRTDNKPRIFTDSIRLII